MPYHRSYCTSSVKWLPLCILAGAMAACGGKSSEPKTETPLKTSKHTLFKGGNIITMARPDKIETVEAVWVEDGTIKMAGSMDDINNAIAKDEKAQKKLTMVDLSGKTLLPGFIEPQGHLVTAARLSQLTNVSPCLPAIYETRVAMGEQQANAGDAPCPLYIDQALSLVMADQHRYWGTWRIASGIDPSRMNTAAQRPPSDIFRFTTSPAAYIDSFLAGDADSDHNQTTPVLLFDHSGRVAYVNYAAMHATFGNTLCDSRLRCPGVDEKTIKTKEFQPTDQSARYDYRCNSDGQNCQYTGKLIEPGAFTAFTSAVVAQLEDGESFMSESPSTFVNLAKPIVNDMVKSGITTFVNGGAKSYEELGFLQALANTEKSPLRYITLMAWNALDRSGGKPMSSKAIQAKMSDIWDEGKGYFGVQGVKLWADGSLQSCTAWLTVPYAQNGYCSFAGHGQANYPSAQVIASHLRDFFDAGNYINIHASGDAAIQAAINAFTTLGEDCDESDKNNSPKACSHMHTLVRFTVENPGAHRVNDLSVLRRKLDVTTSHMISDVVYWGAAFQGILDGAMPTYLQGQRYVNDTFGRAATLVPMFAEQSADIPYSLHSGLPISRPKPLRMVEHALTRETWIYPHLAQTDAMPMPGNQFIHGSDKAMATYRALLAVTRIPARQHQLDDKLGSIEAGKKADFVLLAGDPLNTAHNRIGSISVLSTFVNGEAVMLYDVEEASAVTP